MDPLSITASAIAVGGFVASIGKGVKALKSLGDAPDEFCALLNELTMLQMVTQKFDEISANFPTTELDTFRENLGRIVESLESLVTRFEKSSKGIDRHGRQKISPIQWRRERAKIQRLRDQARQTRDYLTTYLATLNTSESFHQSWLLLQIQGITQLSSDNLVSWGQSAISIESQLRRIHEGLENTTNTSAETETYYDALPRIPERRIGGVTEDVPCDSTHVDQYSSSGPIRSGPDTPFGEGAGTKREPTECWEQEHSTSSNSIFCLQAALRCSLTCRCCCHTATSVQVPTYLRKVVGAFFISYNAAVTFRGQGCDFSGCSGPSSSKIQFCYYFPAWIASCAVQFSASWDSLRGKGATLSLKIPRVIPFSSSIWHAIEIGQLLYIQNRFFTRRYYPTDIDDRDGESLLLVRAVALRFRQWDIARYLLQQGSDASARSVSGFSAASYAKQRLLLGSSTGKSLLVYQEIVKLAGDDHTSTTVHDSVLGINGIPIDKAIRLEPASINLSDSLGNKPLHMAVRLKNHQALDALLHANADTEARDIQSRTPLHIACRRGDLSAVTKLLGAGCDINAKDIDGRTPLHFAVRRSALESQPDAPRVVDVLLQGGADVEVVEGVNGKSPLNDFVCLCDSFTTADENTINALLAAGADINQRGHSGTSPLLCSIRRKKGSRLFKFLHSRGAKLDVRNNNQESVLHYVAYWGDLELMAYLRGLPTLDLDPDSEDGRGNTPLDEMVWRANASSEELSAAWIDPMRSPTFEEFVAFEGLTRELRARRDRDRFLLESLPLRDLDPALSLV